MMNRIIMALATGLGAGNMKRAPGTWGSLVAFVPWILIKDLSYVPYLLVLAAVFLVGFFVAGSAEKILDCPDSGAIVIDEILGMLITLFAAPAHPLAWALGFLLFRFFDIVKPFPVSWCDKRIHGGIGIMIDDVVAGLYALASLQLLWRVGQLFFQ